MSMGSIGRINSRPGFCAPPKPGCGPHRSLRRLTPAAATPTTRRRRPWPSRGAETARPSQPAPTPPCCNHPTALPPHTAARRALPHTHAPDHASRLLPPLHAPAHGRRRAALLLQPCIPQDHGARCSHSSRAHGAGRAAAQYTGTQRLVGRHCHLLVPPTWRPEQPHAVVRQPNGRCDHIKSPIACNRTPGACCGAGRALFAPDHRRRKRRNWCVGGARRPTSPLVG
jgi:hypothetical protein